MPPKADNSVIEKLDKLLAGQDELKKSHDELKKSLDLSLKRIDELEAQAAVLTGRLDEQEETILQLRNSLNTREQKEKLNAIRVNNFPVMEDEVSHTTEGAAALASKVFNRVLKPVLEAAITNGALDALPAPSRVISKIYRAGRSVVTTSANRPPPLVITFADPVVRMAILRFKRNNIPAPNTSEKSVGTKKFIISEDLTTANYHLLWEIQGRDEVEKAWTAGGVIHFVKTGDSAVKKARDVFLPIDQILG